MGDYFRVVTSPDKFSSDQISGRDTTLRQHTGHVTFVLFFNRATTHIREQIFATITQKTRSGVRKTLFG